MFYSRWETSDNMKKCLTKVDYTKAIERSGLPLIYEEGSAYIANDDGHSLIIGSTGSGKSQALIRPLVKLAMLANESVVVNDPKGELYKTTSKEFKNRGYNTIVIDFDSSIYGNYYNPLTLPYKLYKEEKEDECINMIEEIGYYLFTDKSLPDPFWENSAIDFFTGLCLYLFKNSKGEVNLKEVFEFADRFTDDKECKKLLEEIGKNNAIYYNISGTLLAPKETRGGIISTFNQKLKRFINKNNLSDMMSKTDFNLDSIASEKNIVYIISGYYDYNNSLIPLFVNQIFSIVNIYGKKNKIINVILDEFDNLLPIKNFAEIINYSRGIGIRFTVAIKSLVNLINTYGKDNLEIIKLCFPKIVYLYANDLVTLEDFSKLCGNKSEKELLISPEELKLLERFEGVFLIPRMMPFKTTLLPDYKIDWKIDFKENEFELRKLKKY